MTCYARELRLCSHIYFRAAEDTSPERQSELPVAKQPKLSVNTHEFHYRFDIAQFVGKRLSPDEKYDLLNNVYRPDSNFSFPATVIGDRRRSFQHSWLSRYPGLVYSPSDDGAYCLSCVLFSSDIDKRGQLVKLPYKNWKKATSQFDEHFHNKRHNSGNVTSSTHRKTGTGYQAHMNCMTAAQDFSKCMANKQQPVNLSIDTALVERKRKNMLVMTSIVETIVLCGRQNIALRGSRDDERYESDSSRNVGNFRALLQYRVSGGDSLLEEHVATAPKNATYKSKTIQNELISIIGSMIQKQIVADCQEAGGWFSLSADEVRDVANKEQLAVTIRFTDVKDMIREEFVGFVDVSEGTTGEILSSKLLNLIKHLNLDGAKMRSQCYDGAGNMAGKVKGVGARIQSVFPKALPFWCTAHQLNRCVVHACDIPTVRNMMGTADQIVRFFEFSPHKQHVLEEKVQTSVSDDCTKVKLKELCRTRWVERHDAFEVFIDFLPAVVEALEEFAKLRNTRRPGAADASSLLNSICRFEFLVCLIIVHRCLAYVKGLSKALQEKALDVGRALGKVSLVTDSIQDARENVEVFHATCFQKAVALAEQLDVDVSKPRTCKRQTKRDNVPAEDAESYFRKIITIPFLDHILGEMKTRFSPLQERATMGMKLLPTIMTSQLDSGMFDYFSDDIPSKGSLDAELHQWFRLWQGVEEKPVSITETLLKCDADFFPNIKVILKIAGTFPVTSCECERSISVLRLLKTYLRSTMGQDRLTSQLALMYVHRAVAIDNSKVIAEFVQRQPRKILLPNILQED